MSTKKFIFFNVGFWLVATLLMFAEAYPRAQTHIQVSIVRHMYLPIIGFLLSFVLIAFFNSAFFKAFKARLILLVGGSVLLALVTAILLNPVTYLMLAMMGREAPITHQAILSTGTFYFLLLYLIWSILYLQLEGRTFLSGGNEVLSLKGMTFRVERSGEKLVLKDNDVCLFKANGDYVELVTKGQTFLIKNTIVNLEGGLDEARFKRVHRSAIVNKDKVTRVIAKPGSTFEISLEGGHKIKSSRSYKVNVEAILPKA